MRNSVIFKRVLPFFLALSAGLFVASFFVDIMPKFPVRDYRVERCRELQRLRIENDDLRRQNDQLRDQLDSFRHGDLHNVPRGDWNTSRFEIPQPPAPPAAPRYIR